MRYLLKNGTVVSGEKSMKADVLTDGEKILAVGEKLPEDGANVIDVTGKLLFPGFIDGHTHLDLDVAGTVTADDFETGTKAALLGGTTMVVDYASQDKGGHTLKKVWKNGTKRQTVNAPVIIHSICLSWNGMKKQKKRSRI